nr:hypothetical protein [Anaerolineae bacterium]
PVVKPVSADDTAGAARWEPRPSPAGFLILITGICCPCCAYRQRLKGVSGWAKDDKDLLE